MKNFKITLRKLLFLAAGALFFGLFASCEKAEKTKMEATPEVAIDSVQAPPVQTDLYAGMERKIKINIGTVGERRHIMNTRGKVFGGVAVLVGTGRNQRAHIYTSTFSEEDLVPGSIEKIDVKKLAAELGVVACVLNPGRFWTMDEIDLQGGEIVDFQGVKLIYGGDMTSDEVMGHFGSPYVIGKILRNTNWIYKAGSQVCLLREPNGQVWVMQEYTNEVDKTLTMENIGEIGPKLKNLPKGWTFETKILEKDLTLDTRRTGTWASIIRDELGNTYEGTGFDDLANYIP